MVIAHQGGWDEVGFVLIPLLIIATLLAIANRRANKRVAERETSDRPDFPGESPPGQPR